MHIICKLYGVFFFNDNIYIYTHIILNIINGGDIHIYMYRISPKKKKTVNMYRKKEEQESGYVPILHGWRWVKVG